MVKRLAVPVVLVLVTLTSVLVTARETAEAGLPVEGPIAFQREVDFQWDIFTMNPDGSNQTNITNSDDYEQEPDWSPDGTRIAFASDRASGSGNHDIWVMNFDGSNPVRLTTNAAHDGEPSWSPDGNRIAFVSNRDGNQELYVMNADGSNQTRRTIHPGLDVSPDWSPDGTRIVYQSHRNGNAEVFTRNPNGIGSSNISNNAAADGQPAWSPGGGTIAFGSFRDGNWELYSMNTNGSAQTRRTTDGLFDGFPAWSPTGGRMAYQHDQDIYTVNANGTSPTNVSNNPAAERNPSWTTPCTAHPLTDVPQWVDNAVDWAFCGSIMSGFGNLTFRPNLSITRAQVARQLYRAAGSPGVGHLPGHGFSDVPAWVDDAVTWLKYFGYMTGYPNNTFRPDLPITRGQVARATHRVHGSQAAPAHSFTDVPPWLTQAVNWVAHDPDGGGIAQPLMTGYADNTFRDTLDITRAQTARLTCRANTPAGTC